MRRVRIAGCLVGAVAALAIGGRGAVGFGTNARPARRRPDGGRRAPLPAADCRALARLAEGQAGTALTLRSTPTPPLSHCRLSGPRTQVNVYLDAGFAANQRYHNRIEETVQFNGQNPDGLPRPVPHVGEKAAYNSDASWIQALGSLLAV